MTNVKKYLDGFYWYDLANDELFSNVPDAKANIDYPSVYQSHFGLAPATFLKIADKLLPSDKLLQITTFLISEGFHTFEMGCESFKFIHYSRKIFISGETASDVKKNKDDDDDDDDDDDFEFTSGEYSVSLIENETIYISTLPTVENKKFLEKIIKKFHTILIDNKKQVDKFYLIAQNNRGLFTQKTKFKSIPIKDNRYDLFYGRKLPYDKMRKFISDETDNLMLLHGAPGTGKSNLIKHIITDSKKKIIYIAPSMLSVLSTPQFVTFMMRNRNSILLIEDAEEVLSIDRNSATNNLLGLTDGFLKDSLGLKVIATFNCDIGKIDPALMRKGRMFLEYQFNKLTVDECKDLADYLDNDRPVKEPMTLAEFFNVEDNHIESNSFEERRIGFL